MPSPLLNLPRELRDTIYSYAWSHTPIILLQRGKYTWYAWYTTYPPIAIRNCLETAGPTSVLTGQPTGLIMTESLLSCWLRTNKQILSEAVATFHRKGLLTMHVIRHPLDALDASVRKLSGILKSSDARELHLFPDAQRLELDPARGAVALAPERCWVPVLDDAYIKKLVFSLSNTKTLKICKMRIMFGAVGAHKETCFVPFPLGAGVRGKLGKGVEEIGVSVEGRVDLETCRALERAVDGELGRGRALLTILSIASHPIFLSGP